ncbi:response regulator [bacterium]|nr:response regulator [bacterium]
MRRVLIVDDEAGMRHSLQRLLQSGGYEVSTAKSGERALALAKETPFDVAVMDIQMPGLSGLDAFRRLREIDPKLPVVFITAYGTSEAAMQAVELGAYDYILKPFDVGAFKEVIDRAAEFGHRSRTHVTIHPPLPDGRP